MSLWSSVTKAVKDVYDWTSDSDSSIGKVARYAYPFNATYLARDAWREGKDALFGSLDGGSTGGMYVNSAGSLYGYTGSIRGRY